MICPVSSEEFASGGVGLWFASPMDTFGGAEGGNDDRDES